MEKKEDYPLIPMSEITDEARDIAVIWMEGCDDKDWIGHKHKLASDIMNYHRSQQQNDELRNDLIDYHMYNLFDQKSKKNRMIVEALVDSYLSKKLLSLENGE